MNRAMWAAAALLAGLLAVGACGGTGMGGTQDFDRAAWASGRGNYEGENVRATLAGSVAAAGVRPGASRSTVRDLLGEPDSTGPEADIYYLGRSRSGPTFELYRVDYGRDGRVTAAGIRRN